MNWEAQTDDLAWQCEGQLRVYLKELQAENTALKDRIKELLKAHASDPHVQQLREYRARED